MSFLVEKFKGLNIRFLNAPNGKPVLIATDLLSILKEDKNNVNRIVEKYVREKWVIDMPNPNGGRPVKCLFEPGVYQLCGNPMFNTDFAIEFQDWLFEEVLPKLRASGGYIMPNATSNQLEALQAEISQLQTKVIKGKETIATLLMDNKDKQTINKLFKKLKTLYPQIFLNPDRQKQILSIYAQSIDQPVKFIKGNWEVKSTEVDLFIKAFIQGYPTASGGSSVATDMQRLLAK